MHFVANVHANEEEVGPGQIGIFQLSLRLYVSWAQPKLMSDKSLKLIHSLVFFHLRARPVHRTSVQKVREPLSQLHNWALHIP